MQNLPSTDSSKWRKQYPNLVEGLTPTRPEELNHLIVDLQISGIK